MLNGMKYIKRINWSKEFEEFLIRNNIYSQTMTAIFKRNSTFKDYTRCRPHFNYIYDLYGLLAPDIISWDKFWELDNLWVDVCYIIIENESI